jgi:hypothetical protein
LIEEIGLEPQLSHVCTIDVDVGPMHDLGSMPRGRRRVVAILGGIVLGDRLRGQILPGGADWQYLRNDGVVELVARYLIRSADGTDIAVTNRGFRHAAPELMERLSKGEPVDPALIYFRTAPMFEAPEGPFEWLNRSLFIAAGARHPDKVRLRVFEVL